MNATGRDSSPQVVPTGRTGRDLIAAAKPFAREMRAKSWWFVWSTLAMLLGVLTVAALATRWPVRLAASVVGGLLMVRCFILYHDFIHGAILRRSRVAKVLLYIVGGLLLAPPSSWRQSHDLHHANMGKLHSAHTGGFPLMTVAEWRSASRMQRLGYRIGRHPLTMATAAITIFLGSLTLLPLVKDVRKHWDSLLALSGHAASIGLLWWFGGFTTALFALILPYAISAAMGAYLFFVQHNFVGMRMLGPDEWSREKAALVASSHLDLGLIMRWFTGEIGYHHVHHLNRAIPFYRLAEAVQAIPELQRPSIHTTLFPRDVIACLRLALWDEDEQRMVSYRDVTSTAEA